MVLFILELQLLNERYFTFDIQYRRVVDLNGQLRVSGPLTRFEAGRRTTGLATLEHDEQADAEC